MLRCFVGRTRWWTRRWATLAVADALDCGVTLGSGGELAVDVMLGIGVRLSMGGSAVLGSDVGRGTCGSVHVALPLSLHDDPAIGTNCHW